jgi:hypothetical protein
MGMETNEKGNTIKTLFFLIFKILKKKKKNRTQIGEGKNL